MQFHRSLSQADEEIFRSYAQTTDPPDMDSWELYHPICREEWIKRGIVGPDTPRPALPRTAYVPVPRGKRYILGQCEEAIAGYTPVLGTDYGDFETAQAEATKWNERLGINEMDAVRVVCSSLWRRRARRE